MSNNVIPSLVQDVNITNDVITVKLTDGLTIPIKIEKSENERLMDIAQQLFCYHDFQNSISTNEATIANNAIRRAKVLVECFKKNNWL